MQQLQYSQAYDFSAILSEEVKVCLILLAILPKLRQNTLQLNCRP